MKKQTTITKTNQTKGYIAFGVAMAIAGIASSVGLQIASYPDARHIKGGGCVIDGVYLCYNLNSTSVPNTACSEHVIVSKIYIHSCPGYVTTAPMTYPLLAEGKVLVNENTMNCLSNGVITCENSGNSLKWRLTARNPVAEAECGNYKKANATSEDCNPGS